MLFSRTYRNLIFILFFASIAGFFTSRLVEIPLRSALRGWDNSFYLFWVRSVVIDGDIDFANEVIENNTIADKDRERAYSLPRTDREYVPNKYGIGVGLAALPFYLLADSLLCVGHSLGITETERDGYNAFYQVSVQLGMLVYAMAGWWALIQILKRWFSEDVSKVAVCLGIGCSMLLYYQSVNLTMAHNLVFVLWTFILWMTLKIEAGEWRTSWQGSVWGLMCGWLIVTRYQAAIYLLLPAIVGLRVLMRNPRAMAPVALATIAGGGAILFLQSFAWRMLYGSWVVYGYEGEGFDWAAPAKWSVLFSANHGLFYWHPLLFIGVAGFVVMTWKKMPILSVVLVSMVMNVWLNGAWLAWNMGSSFGMRAFECVVLPAAIGIAYAFERVEAHPFLRRGFYAITLGLFIWNIHLCLLYTIGLISRNEAVSLCELYRATIDLYTTVIPSVF
jgi:hypothetical protein